MSALFRRALGTPISLIPKHVTLNDSKTEVLTQTVNPSEWQSIKEAFSTALSLSESDRNEFLSRLELPIRSEVVSLLQAYEKEGDVLEDPLVTTSGALLGRALESAFERDSIGPYTIVGQLGRGGMGAVYRAMRSDSPKRQFAIKVIRPELNQKLLVRRFQQELQILKQLRHPYIAGVLDSGATDDDEPYFVMDLIEGLPLDEYCDSNTLAIKQRLVLFLNVCEAVSAAHSMGIIHRDLKPSNILITTSNEPRLLDFGIAKIVGADLETGALTRTMTAQRLMTPEYASPEQIRGEEISTVSDVYSLGVLLYELLTGCRPHSITRTTLEGAAVEVRDEQPLKPSVRLSRINGCQRSDGVTLEVISARRDSTPKILRRKLKGKLDNIVMKALAQNPAERYQSVRQLSRDIQRYLDRQPVSARGEPLISRAKRLVLKNTLVYASFALLIAVTAISIVSRRQPEQIDFSNSRISAVFSSTDPESQPSLNPKGDRLAFVWQRAPDNNPDIYVSLRNGQSPRRLTFDKAQHFSPAWSPDGSQIAFMRVENGSSSVWTMSSSDGKILRHVTDLRTARNQNLGRPLEWSGDGRYLYISDVGPLDSLEIFQVEVANGGRSAVTNPPPHAVGDGSPRVSPDDKLIAFIRTIQGGTSAVYVQPRKGGEPHKLAFDAIWASGLTWAPDGRFLILASIRGPQAGLWQLSENQSPKRLPVSEDGLFDPFFARDGKQLFYCLETLDSNIWRTTLALPGLATKSKLVVNVPSVTTDPRVSPDGKRLAYISEMSGPAQIWISDIDGGQSSVLTRNKEAVLNLLSWSPDGQWILFSESAHSPFRLFIVPSSGGEPRRVTRSVRPHELDGAWSHDGKFIYFSSNETGRPEIWRTAGAEPNPVQLTLHGGRHPRQSWDGRFIYYAKTSLRTDSKGGNEGVWRIPTEGGFEEKVLHLKPEDWGNWDLGHEGIYFASGDRDAELFYYDLRSGRTTMVEKLGFVPSGEEDVALSPDEHFIFYSKIDNLRKRIMSLERSEER